MTKTKSGLNCTLVIGPERYEFQLTCDIVASSPEFVRAIERQCASPLTYPKSRHYSNGKRVRP